MVAAAAMVSTAPVTPAAGSCRPVAGWEGPAPSATQLDPFTVFAAAAVCSGQRSPR